MQLWICFRDPCRSFRPQPYSVSLVRRGRERGFVLKQGRGINLSILYLVVKGANSERLCWCCWRPHLFFASCQGSFPFYCFFTYIIRSNIAVGAGRKLEPSKSHLESAPRRLPASSIPVILKNEGVHKLIPMLQACFWYGNCLEYSVRRHRVERNSINFIRLPFWYYRAWHCTV